MKSYGITIDFDIQAIEEAFGEVEFTYKDSKYMLADESFYFWNNDVNDDQESEWEEVKDINLLEELEECLFEQEEIVEYMIDLVEQRIQNISDKGRLKVYITEI